MRERLAVIEELNDAEYESPVLGGGLEDLEREIAASVDAMTDEDLERENETKTSAVHFLRFQFPAEDIEALRAGAELAFGIDHEAYAHAVDPVPAETRKVLLADFD